MATGGIEDTSDVTFVFMCSPCADDGRNAEAVSYCVNCQGYCCRPCSDVHRIIPVLKKHTVLDKTRIKSEDAGANLPAVPTQRCSKHALKIVDLYCDDDDEVGCSTCMALDHRSCLKVQSVTHSLQTLWKKSEVADLMTTLERKQVELPQIIDSQRSYLERLEITRNEAATSIRTCVEDMKSVLTSMEQKTLVCLEERYQIHKSKITEKMKHSKESNELVKRYSDELKRIGTNKAQLFVCSKLAEKALRDLHAYETHRIADTMEFNQDDGMKVHLSNLNLLGVVNVFSSYAWNKPKSTPYKVKFTRNLNVKTPNDKHLCDIYSICLRGDGSLLLIDFKNKQLKYTDALCTLVSNSIALNEYPSGVCFISNTEVALAFNEKYIDVVSSRQERTRVKRFNLEHPCFDIYPANGKLMITDDSKQLHIYDLNFTHLKTVSEDMFGMSVFSSSRRVSCSDSGDRLFVTDWINGVIVLDENGNYIETVKEQQIFGADGICADRRGNVFVCGYNSNNVVQMSQEGSYVGLILGKLDGIERPQGVCFNELNNTLFVALQGSDEVRVFELE